MTQYEIESLWVKSKLDVAYEFDDAVRLKTGERAGDTGRVVALFQLEPVPYYMIEFPDGASVPAPETELERAASQHPKSRLILKR